MNEYVVGGSMLLIGVGFFSVRFADILAFRIGNIPNQIPVVGGEAITVGRVLGLIPLSIGVSVLSSKILGRTVPIVEDISEAAVGTLDAASRNATSVNPVEAEELNPHQLEGLRKPRSKKFKKGQKVGISHDTSKPKSKKPWQLTKNAESSSVGGSPAQKLWRECVRDAKGDMTLAKKLRNQRKNC